MLYQFSFLIATIFLLLIWLILFLLAKSSRREMLRLSLISGSVAPFIELINLRDWWSPVMFTLTKIGIEDFLYGFTIAGISVAIYPLIFKAKFKESHLSKAKQKINNKKTMILLIIGAGLFSGISFTYNSLIGFFISSIFITSTILFLRKDLVTISAFSGLVIMFLCIPMYLLVEQLTPGWIVNTWQLNNFSNRFILGIPLEEYVWHFLAGTNASIIYKFWKNSKTISNNNNKQY